ncbi:hypothetical protein Scep_009406 [Stephania cephalantha]|uniref:Hexosyltransferase n=1 Tax=Stephania cephalantha TaxID=152367 RepID=A0AAP0JVH0_9MAGN
MVSSKPHVTRILPISSSVFKLHLLITSLLSLSLSLFLLVMTYTSISSIIIDHIQDITMSSSLDQSNNKALHVSFNDESNVVEINQRLIEQSRHSRVLEFLAKELGGKKTKFIKVGLVNTHHHKKLEDDIYEWKGFGETSVVDFERVPKERRWEEFFPEWIDEEEKWNKPACPNIPMPRHEDYGEFDVVVARFPCKSYVNNNVVYDQIREGIRDVFMLQVNLVVANLVVKNGRRSSNNGDYYEDVKEVYVVFLGSCGPMWEIFRCDDLLFKHDQEGENEEHFWIYKPEFKRLKQKVNMPVGTCQIAAAHDHQQKDDQDLNYDFSKLGNSNIEHPKEAYVTVLHSSEAYVCGAIALAQSIIQTNTTKDLVLLADESITKKRRKALSFAGWKIKHISRIRSTYAKKDTYNEWNYSKLRIWQLVEYDKVIFIDSDLIVLENIDKFFKFPQLSARGNNKVLFNSGIMLIEPSKCVFDTLMNKRRALVSYNGGDQGFLNEAFTWWHRWPTRMNYLKIYENFMNHMQREVPKSGANAPYAIHYLGLKPWVCYKDYDCNWDLWNHRIYASDSAHWRWWRLYDSMPNKLHSFCGLSRKMNERIKRVRERARAANFSDQHWKIKVKDPRQYQLIN